MAEVVTVYRCEQDRRYTLYTTQAQLMRHLGHRVRPVTPPLWVRWLIRLGWRP